MLKMNKKRLFLYLILLLKIHLIQSDLIETNKFKLFKKNQWIKHLLSRSKRSFNDELNKQQQLQHNHYQQHQQHLQQQRPCPQGCTCSYDTVNCNELIDECHECVHWHQIDFNQITEMKPHTFNHFKFAPNRTTHIIIYKLLNSSLTETIFDSLHVPSNAQLEITFQYNSVIKLDKYALSGVKLDTNSTLVFNFPYTTQVVFVSKCFHGVNMRDHNSRLIIRILKSFSVRFVGEYYSNNFWKTARLLKNNNINNNSIVQNWSISTGQFIIDIKSTHLVKFEDNSFSHLKLNKQAKFYLDLDIIEKLMIQRNSFSHLTLNSASKLILYAKHITFIDFKAYSFSHINLNNESKFQIYLEELISSICLQRNVFSHMKLNEAHTHFNFSIINSKNVMLMHDSFSNIELNSHTSRLFIGVFNSPSYLLKLKSNSASYYQSFIKERFIYKWSSNANLNDQYDQYSNHYAAPFSLTNSEYFYSSSNSLPSQLSNHVQSDLKNFYLTNKQTYSYNVSIERNCFSNLSFNFENNQMNNLNIWIAADNVKTLLIDDYIVDYTNMPSQTNMNFLLNVKYFVLSPNALQNLHRLRIEFLTEPKLIKFGLISSKLISRHIDIVGLNKLTPYFVDYFNQSENNNNNLNDEQDNLDDPFNENSSNLVSNKVTLIDDFCHIAFQQGTKFSIQMRSQDYDNCSCPIIYFYMNQIKSYKTMSSLLNCDIDIVNQCRKDLETKCNVTQSEYYREDYLNDFVKFWDYCITELEPYQQIQNQQLQQQQHSSDQQQKTNFFSNSDLDTGNLYFNNFNDPDGMFSASLSSSSSIFDQSLDSFNKPPVIQQSSQPNLSTSNTNANSIASNIGKIIGIVIVSFLSGIILFMIVINIIQYKFRNELLDDLDYSSQPNLNLNQNGNRNSNSNSSHNNNDDLNEQINNDIIRRNGLECKEKLKKKNYNEKIKFIRNDSVLTEINESIKINGKDYSFEEEEDEEEKDDEFYNKQKYESEGLFNDEGDQEDQYPVSRNKKLNRQLSMSQTNKLTKTKLSQDSGIIESDRASTPPPPYENTNQIKHQQQTNKIFLKNNKVSLA